MGIVPAKCTQCGGVLEVDNNMEAAVCPHCGTAFIVEKAINNYNTTNNVSVNNAVINLSGVNLQVNNQIDIDGHLNRGKNYLKFFQYDDAEKCFMKVLEYDPNNEVAKTGIMIKNLSEGCLSFEEKSFDFWKKNGFDSSPNLKAMEQWVSILSDMILKTRAVTDNTVYIHDFLGLRASVHEKNYINTSYDFWLYLFKTYHNLAMKLSPEYEYDVLAEKRAQYYGQKFRMSFFTGNYKSALINKGLVKVENNQVVFYEAKDKEQMNNFKNEFQIAPQDRVLMPTQK